MSRYALWLVPLVIPVIGSLATFRGRGRSLALVLTVALSCYVSSWTYHPLKLDGLYWPSWIGSWIWEHEPGLDNPPVQIFVERVVHDEVPARSAATESCSKVLVIDGIWPESCDPPPQLPDLCDTSRPHAASGVDGSACYANRVGNRYTFAEAP